jgi:hypothetical protein
MERIETDLPYSSEVSLESNSRKRKRPGSRTHTRVLAACDACRMSKTRCDSVRPVCAKCVQRGVACIYPDRDPFSMRVYLFFAPMKTADGLCSDLSHGARES